MTERLTIAKLQAGIARIMDTSLAARHVLAIGRHRWEEIKPQIELLQLHPPGPLKDALPLTLLGFPVRFVPGYDGIALVPDLFIGDRWSEAEISKAASHAMARGIDADLLCALGSPPPALPEPRLRDLLLDALEHVPMVAWATVGASVLLVGLAMVWP